MSTEPKSEVVVLYSSDTGLPATEAIRRGFRAILHPNEDSGPDLYEEYLDAARFPGPAHLEAMASLLDAKYSGRPVDVIVALGPTALEFVLQRKAKLFPNAKLVFAGIREERANALVLPPDSFGIVSKLDPVETLELALHLQPKARQGYVITGSASFDKSWEAIARTKLASFEPRLSLTFLAGLPLESVLERVSALPPDSIIIHLSMFEDGTGRTFVPREVAGKIASAADAPVYSVYDTYSNVSRNCWPRAMLTSNRLFPKATYERRKRGALRLSWDEGTRVARVARVWNLALDVWQSEERETFCFVLMPCWKIGVRSMWLSKMRSAPNWYSISLQV